MDIVVEDGTGLPTANSYCSADDADAFNSINIYATAWAALTDVPTKANLLMWATQLIEEKTKWTGWKVHHTSGLSWPRFRVVDKEGRWIDDNVVPTNIKKATAYLANFLLVNGADPEALDSSNNLKELKVDVVELVFNPDIIKNRYPKQVRELIEPMGWISMGGGGPKYIVRH